MAEVPPIVPEMLKIPLPDDDESKISVFLWASDLVMQERVTHLAYKDEVSQKQIAGLSRLPRDVERANKEHLATHIRLYGPISQLAGTTRRENAQRLYIIGAIFLLSVVIFGSYLAYYPYAQLELAIWWGAYGTYVEAFLLMFALLFLYWYGFRRRRKPKV